MSVIFNQLRLNNKFALHAVKGESVTEVANDDEIFMGSCSRPRGRDFHRSLVIHCKSCDS